MAQGHKRILSIQVIAILSNCLSPNNTFCLQVMICIYPRVDVNGGTGRAGVKDFAGVPLIEIAPDS